MLASLDGLDPDDLEKIKSKLFVFDDIPRLTARARLLLFDDIPSDVIITALRGADKNIVDVILSSLSQRSRRMVEAELKSPNDVLTQVDITNARRTIAQDAIKLANEGKITLTSDADAAQDSNGAPNTEGDEGKASSK